MQLISAWGARGLIALLVAAASVSPVLVRASNGTVETIQIVPRTGYSGGLIDLSGTGFKPLTKTILFMACPNYLDPTVYEDKNYVHLFGPTTDINGDIAGFLFHVPTLRHRTPPIGCQLYIIVPDEGPGFAATTAFYRMYPHSFHLDPCVVTMCSHVVVSPRRVRAGLRERITVAAWPGARADVAVSYPRATDSHPDSHYVKHLDWQGNLSMSVPVPSRMPDATWARVTVRTSLGKMQDTKYGNFTITR